MDRTLLTHWPRLVKGHGTGNDFLLLADPTGALPMRAEEIVALTDRHRGLGADGVIRAVRTDALASHEPLAAQALREEPRAEWFMDYRNADGSIAQMCGNGLRVMVRFLLEEGLADLPDGAVLPVATRAGVLRVRREGELLAASMGRWGLPEEERARSAGWDVEVTVPGIEGTRPGLSVTMPNPHVVIAVASQVELAAADLAHAPVVVPAPVEGTNVEIVWAEGEIERGGERWGVVRMRVHERGVGETQSCGTGACAAALAACIWAGADAPTRWVVHVSGGTLEVELGPDQQVTLRGPAVLVGDVTLRG